MPTRIAGTIAERQPRRASRHDDPAGLSRCCCKCPGRSGFVARGLLLCALFGVAVGRTQVLAPEEIRDPQMRALQEKYRNELKLITSASAAHTFPYNFYFSRKLDLEEKDQKQNDQRSIQFDRYHDKVVLKITGNYFASYSAELVKPEERARQTYETVMLPLLRAAVGALATADQPQAFAFEISHHVRRKIIGVASEGTENVVLVLPREAARRLVASADPGVQEAALFEGEAYLNAKPVFFWARPAETSPVTVASQTPPEQVATPLPRQSSGLFNLAAKVAPEGPALASPATHDDSPDALRDLQKNYQPALDRMVKELESQAHFVTYAPPAFVPFHHGVYLQLSVTTTLPQASAGSQYRQAALAFDQHIAHLIRPVLASLRERRDDFDGIDFSTTVRFASAPGEEGSPIAAEFISPLKLLSAYSDFDSTGQQVIDGSFVLINGERVSLNLQAAETGSTVE